MSRYVLMTHTEQAITSTLYPAWNFCFYGIKILPYWLLKAREHLWNKKRSVVHRGRKHLLRKHHLFQILASEWGSWKSRYGKRCRKREKNTGAEAQTLWSLLAPISSPELIPGSKEHWWCKTMGEKKNQEVHQKISGHIFYHFPQKFLLIISLAWHK